MSKVLFGELSLKNVRNLPLTLCERRTESDNPCVFCLEIVGTISYFDEVFYFFFFGVKKLIYFFYKTSLVLKEPDDFLPLLGYIFRGQQDRFMAIADEIMEIEGTVEVRFLIILLGDISITDYSETSIVIGPLEQKLVMMKE